MVHSYGLGSLGLAAVHAEDSSSDCLGHIGSSVYGYDKDSCTPHGEVNVEELGHAVVDEGGLKHHWSSSEYLYIGFQYPFHYLKDGSGKFS